MRSNTSNDEKHLNRLLQRNVAVLGYGVQGRAQALNLRDSGIDITVGLRPDGPSWNKALQDGFRPVQIQEAVEQSKVVLFLLPDEAQPEVYKRDVGPHLKKGTALVFAHGFNVVYEAVQVPPDVDVVLVAPKAPGAAVRQTFVEGGGVPALVAVHQDATGRAESLAMGVAEGLGCTRAGVLSTTFREETETDLFGEQADLCGGVSALVEMAFQVLVDAGYQPEVAYFEALHELKMIVDLIQEGGMESMWERVSNTAEYGGRTRGPRVVDRHVRKNMEEVLKEIQTGAFAEEWREQSRRGGPLLMGLRKGGRRSLLEETGARVRALAHQRQKTEEAVV